jgi:hypothetical protein
MARLGSTAGARLGPLFGADLYLVRIVEQASRDVSFAVPKHPYPRALMSAVP